MMHSTSSSLLLSSTSSSSPDLILGDSNNSNVATAAPSHGGTRSSVSARPPARIQQRRWNQWRTHLLGSSGNGDDDNASSVVEERRHRFERLVHEHPYPAAYVSSLPLSKADGCRENDTLDEDSRSPSNEGNVPSTSLDPLTALVMEEERKTKSMAELDLQYRKDKAMRRRGNHQGRCVADEDESFDANAAALEIIDKDLERLHTHQDKALLRSILFVYHCRHSPDPGYRQGMHEVAGHLLRAATEEYNDSEEDEIGGSARGNEMQQQAPQPQELLSTWVAGDVYDMLEAVLTDITPAYDVPTSSDRKPLEAMGVRIITMVGKADPQLWDRLHNLHVPPAIYLTKWIRLLFGREVRDVMGLWDVVFELASQLRRHADSAHAPPDGVGPRPLLAVLEALAAARLLHHRKQVLLGDDPLHFLMNVPVEDHIAPIVGLTKPILAGQALLLPPIVLPPPEGAASGPTGAPRAVRGSPTSLRSSLISLTTSSATASSAATTPSGAAAGTPSLSTAFTSMRQQFTEALDKTSSISKRLYHEWENLAADRAFDEPQRSYDDDAWQRAPPTTAAATGPAEPNSFSAPPWNSAAEQVGSSTGAAAAAAPRSIVDPVDTPLGGGLGAATSHVASHARALPPASSPAQPSPPFVAAEMEMHVATLQHYCMNAQRVHRDVPPAVWESLAQLERLRQSLLAGGSTQAHPHPPPHHP